MLHGPVPSNIVYQPHPLPPYVPYALAEEPAEVATRAMRTPKKQEKGKARALDALVNLRAGKGIKGGRLSLLEAGQSSR